MGKRVKNGEKGAGGWPHLFWVCFGFGFGIRDWVWVLGLGSARLPGSGLGSGIWFGIRFWVLVDQVFGLGGLGFQIGSQGI